MVAAAGIVFVFVFVLAKFLFAFAFADLLVVRLRCFWVPRVLGF